MVKSQLEEVEVSAPAVDNLECLELRREKKKKGTAKEILLLIAPDGGRDTMHLKVISSTLIP